MCSRFVGPRFKEELAELYAALWRDAERDPDEPDRPWKQNFNTAPTHRIGYIVQEGGKRFANMHRWGFIHRKGFPVVNARCETVAMYPIFMKGLHDQRCIVPMQGFYEFAPDTKAPFYFSHKKSPHIVTAGIWDWFTTKDGKREKRVCIVTTEPTKVALSIGHDRSPLILSADAIGTWLNPDTPITELKPLMVPNDREPIDVRQVTRRVNYVENNSADLLDELDPVKEAEFAAAKAAEKSAKKSGKVKAKKA